MTDDRMKRGAQIRAEVLGQAHVSQPGPNPSKFQKAFQDFTVEHCWGNVWVRPGLERKTRSMLNLGMLSVMGQMPGSTGSGAPPMVGRNNIMARWWTSLASRARFIPM